MSGGVFDDNPFVKVVPGAYPSPEVKRTGMFAKGDYWFVGLRDGEYVSDYLSGELAGRGKRLKISESEAKSLAEGGDAALTLVINAHGGG